MTPTTASLRAGVVVEGGGDLGEGGSGVVDGDDGCVRVGVGDGLPSLLPVGLDNEGGGSVGDGGFEVLVAVDGEAGDGDEEVAARDLARVLPNAMDRRLRIPVDSSGDIGQDGDQRLCWHDASLVQAASDATAAPTLCRYRILVGDCLCHLLYCDRSASEHPIGQIFHAREPLSGPTIEVSPCSIASSQQRP